MHEKTRKIFAEDLKVLLMIAVLTVVVVIPIALYVLSEFAAHGCRTCH